MEYVIVFVIAVLVVEAVLYWQRERPRRDSRRRNPRGRIQR